ncbi:MAG: ATP-binding cassette domain-containing protein [Myxococcota bacterium]
MLDLREVTRSYGDVLAVDRLTLTVERGELLILLGGSGSGKTTTLKMVNRLIEPSSGRILLDGIDTREQPAFELRRRIGYCFQQIGLFPHLTVAENIGITLELLRWDWERRAGRVDELLELVELEPDHFRERAPAELSGGQQQRVGLARALAASPPLLLLDEPFGALDPLTRDRLRLSFREIQRSLGLTSIFVTHDMVEALMLGDRIAVLQSGRLIQLGTPRELLLSPASEEVGALMQTPRRQLERLEALLDARRPPFDAGT